MRIVFLLILLAATRTAPAADCTADLGGSLHVLMKRLGYVRPGVRAEIETLKGGPPTEFWLQALAALKREQELFSDLYYLPKGDGVLDAADQERLMRAYSRNYSRPGSDEEWRRFYFNHLQSLIHFTARVWKEEAVAALAPQLDEPALRVEAWTFPSSVDEPAVRADQLRAIASGITREALLDLETERRLPLARRQICCKSQGGCAYCPHNRRQLKD